MDIRFWGVRGSVATSGLSVARVGGNTSCVEVESQGERIILDAGTGLRGLGEVLAKQGPVRASLFFSHLHWDHVQGFPFFAPAYHPGSQLTLYGPGADGGRRLSDVLVQQMMPPGFPVPFSSLASTISFGSATPYEAIELGPFRILPLSLSHPQGCLGYRIDADGASLVYMTDVELTWASLDPKVAEVIAGADVLIHDAQYTPDEYEGRVGPQRRGWGHSTMVEAARVAHGVDARRLFLFHHDPTHDDEQIEAMVEAARLDFVASEAAREGKRVMLARR
jgi:phosphoribosyl 1,2-cyclic phosphodiesterase